MTEFSTDGITGTHASWVVSNELDEDNELFVSLARTDNEYASTYLSIDETRKLAYALLGALGESPAGSAAPVALTLDEVKHIAKTVAEETVTEQVATIAREHAGREVRRKFRAVISE